MEGIVNILVDYSIHYRKIIINLMRVQPILMKVFHHPVRENINMFLLGKKSIDSQTYNL